MLEQNVKEEDLQNEIVIEDEVEEVQEPEFSIEGLTEGEIEMAKKQGLIKEEKEEEKEDEHEEPSEPETEEDTGTEKEQEQEEEIEEPTFEQVEENEKLIEKYNKNEKALYFRWKTDKQKRQAAQAELEELKASKELQDLKESVSAKKLAQINDALGREDLTVEQLQAIIEGRTAEPQEEKRYTLAEIEEMRRQEEQKQKGEQEKIVARVQLAEQIGKSRYDNFDGIADLAQEVVKQDTTGTYQKILNEVLLNTNIDEDQIVDRVVTIAQLSPKFKDAVNNASPSDKEKVSRAIENSKKRKSTASLGSSGKRVITNEDDLTPEDAAKMDNKQWMKLKPTTRRRLLMGG